MQYIIIVCPLTLVVISAPTHIWMLLEKLEISLVDRIDRRTFFDDLWTSDYSKINNDSEDDTPGDQIEFFMERFISPLRLEEQTILGLRRTSANVRARSGHKKAWN